MLPMQGVPGSIPGQGTRFCMAQPRSGTAKLKKKKNSMPQIQLSLVIRNVLLPNKDHGSHQGCVKVCHNKGSAYPEGTAVHLPPSEATHRGHERDLGVRILNEALFTRGGGSTGPGVSIRSLGSHDKRAAGFAASLSLLRVPRGPFSSGAHS